MQASTPPPALIIGCGFLGKALARRLIESGKTVYGTCRSDTSAKALAGMGVKPLLLSVTQPVTFAAMRPAIESPSLDVYYMVPPGRPKSHPSPRQVVLGGIAHVLKQLRHAQVRRAVLVSSTAVYAQQDGQRVDADSPAEPIDERGKLLLAGEQLWLDAGERYHVVRMAGLYGPGRVIGLNGVREGSPIVGNPDALLNLIHMDDAASLLLAVMEAETTGRIELGCDGNPVPRRDYYHHLAELIGVPPPPWMPAEEAAKRFGLNARRLRNASSKALDNIPTCHRTGWSPSFPTYREGVPEAINASR